MDGVGMTPLKIFIGYDSREPIAYHVLAHSIMSRASIPVSITPLMQPALRQAGLYTRERNPLESTAFSFTRFLVPYLSDYQGISIFMDCDMLCLADVADLRYLAIHSSSAVSVCQHDYTPKDSTKFLGQPQTAYPRKNWSSLMVFNNGLCDALVPAYVNAASGLELHRFHWAGENIGALPLTWNWLVGEYPANDQAQNMHWTNGGPWFPEYAEVDHARLWWLEHADMTGTANYAALALAG
jgi:hypothetical protein